MIEFESIQPYRLASQVTTLISNKILDGELVRGSRLPSERELAAQFKVSRPTLREAIHMLEALGLVEVHHGDGSYVSRNPSALSPCVLKHMLKRDDTLVLDMFAVRKEFEVRNAELAAEHATREDAKRLRKILSVMEADVRAGRDDFDHDIEFHLTVAEGSHNRVRLFITTSVLLAHSEILREARSRMIRHQPGLVEDFLREHRTIYLGIQAAKPQEAGIAMLAHLEAPYAQYAALMSEPG